MSILMSNTSTWVDPLITVIVPNFIIVVRSLREKRKRIGTKDSSTGDRFGGPSTLERFNTTQR